MKFLEKIISYNKEHVVLSHLLFWGVLLLLSVSENKYYYDHHQLHFSFLFTLADCGLLLVTQIMAAYFLAYLIIPKFFLRRKYPETFIYFFIGSYLICVLARVITIHIAEPMAGQAPKNWETFYEIFTNVPKLVYVYFFRIFSVAFVFLFIKLLADQYKIQKRALSLEKEKAETELKLLKTQLNPHFLFNTLNNIYSLSLSNSPVTSASIGRLSEILDYILYRCNSLYVPLSGEIDLLNNYIGLEKLRYDDRLKVNFNTRIEQDIPIPPLILLSIVENAFKHGASEDIGNPVIDIDLQAGKTAFSFIVANSFNTKPGEELNGKIGLSNLKQQLELIYPERHTLAITQTETFYTVTLLIDVIT
ncbi:histidine kinase [Chitinophaga niastensis]|uniref:Histidine kinase n=1 Tax=Chitinophaga niastensis TaxID=536980 RepID=A0A2P8HJY3_CHINA|nr:histidine kinase [Chitinophaga niastensis]PSL46515.1 histidine kinase [Chitinophaga niastensis]